MVPPTATEKSGDVSVNSAEEGYVALTEELGPKESPGNTETKQGIMGLVPSLAHCFRNHPYVILWILMVLSYSVISPTLPLVLTYGFGIGKR